MSERADAMARSEAFVCAPIAYSILDLDGRQLAANPAFQELFAVDDGHVRVEDITHEADRERTAAYLADLVTGKRDRVEIDKRYVRGDGTTFWGRLTAAAVTDGDGRPELLLGMIEDVTGHVDALSQMKSASDAKSGFVARVSHDLRTPLHAIRGLAELLSMAGLGAEELGYAKAIQREAETLRALVDDLLDLSRLEAGQLEFSPSVFHLGSCVRGAIELLTDRAEARGLTLGATIDPDLEREVWGDAERLRQILVNLIDNAIKFTPSGSVRVMVRPAARDNVVVSVRDTGVGIAEADLDEIFEPFGRARGDQPGTGLGLAIARDLAEKMGGSLAVESTTGEGSVFTIRVPLPLAVSTEAAPLHTAAAAPVARADSPMVLVVEDSPINQLLATAQLDLLGCRHELAATGREALDALAQREFDLVLMDWHLPDMDGLETTNRLRAREAEQGASRVPVVAVTARTMTGDRQACLDAGMDDFLAKPVGVDDLARMLRTWLPAELEVDERPADTAPGQPVTDTDAIERLLDDLGDDDLVATLITTFLEELPGRRRVIVAGAAAGDGDAVRRAAHTLKSTSAVLGAADLARISAELEAGAREGTAPLEPLVRDLETAADLVTAEFAGILDRLGSA